MAKKKSDPDKKNKEKKEKKISKALKAASKPKKKTEESTVANGAEHKQPSRHDIAMRAYYISERRVKMGWAGDEHSDWLEAERQLRAELLRKR